MPLTSREDRFALLEALGVPAVLELPFTRELAGLDAGTFVRDMLEPMGLRRLVVGYDFTLGRNRGGQVSVLRELGALTGFSVEQLDPVVAEGTVVSSTSLRGLIGQGDVARAAHLLGRYHSFCGEVVHGDGRGAGLGFPTANQRKPDVVLPVEGVYATRASMDGHDGAANLIQRHHAFRKFDKALPGEGNHAAGSGPDDRYGIHGCIVHRLILHAVRRSGAAFVHHERADAPASAAGTGDFVQPERFGWRGFQAVLRSGQRRQRRPEHQ